MGLRSHGFDAHVAACNLAFTDSYLNGETPLPPFVHKFSRNNVASLLSDVEPDVVVLQHWGIAHEVPELDVPLVIDLAGPHLLERLYWNTPDLIADAEMKLAALRRADFVVCSGAYQRHYFYGWLALAGFDLREAAIPIIPFSVPPETEWPSEEIPREPASFVYGGMLLAWQDPTDGLLALIDEMDRAKRGRLHLFTGSHPVLDASAPHFQKLLDYLRTHPRVEMHGIQPFHELLKAYANCEVAFDLMAFNPERELAFTTRTMVYLACGLPVIHDDYSELGELLSREGGGWALSPTNEEGLRRLIRDLLEKRELVAAKREEARQFARKYTWDRTIEPLARFCDAPTFRKNKNTVALRMERIDRELAQMRQRCEELEHELASVKGKLLFRLAAKMGKFRRFLAPLVWVVTWPIARYIERRLLKASR